MEKGIKIIIITTKVKFCWSNMTTKIIYNNTQFKFLKWMSNNCYYQKKNI